MFRRAWPAFALLASACSGNVVIDTGGQPAGGEGGSAGSSAGGAAGASGASHGGAAGTSSGPGGFGGYGACVPFCAAAAKAGCTYQDCQASCELLFQETCTDELVAVLECAPPLLTNECHLAYPPGDASCLDSVDALQSCAVSTAGAGCSPVEVNLAPDGGCEGKADCSTGALSMACSVDGDCSCFMNGTFVAGCQNIIGGTELCLPMLGCCAAALPL